MPEDVAITPTTDAAATPAVPVQRNCRRDIADVGPQALQKHEKPPAEPALRKSVMGASRNDFYGGNAIRVAPRLPGFSTSISVHQF
ncbi:MAG TPA: hypothetical protein VNO18_04175 [Xanthobacteraceae bacterium]|nr:hypothetical protein [Xanthobacteraceae bacterium]